MTAASRLALCVALGACASPPTGTAGGEFPRSLRASSTAQPPEHVVAARAASKTSAASEASETSASIEAAATPEPSAPPPPAPPPRPRLTSIASPTWIYGRPRADERYVGAIRVGTSVTLKSTDRVSGEKCKGGFFEVEPRGFVCADARVTLTPSERISAWTAATAAKSGPLPFRYAFSDAAPMYGRLPTPKEQARIEGRFGPAVSQTRPPRTASSYEDLASTDPFEPVEEAPSFLTRGFFDEKNAQHEKLPAGSMVSFTKVVSDAANGGRTYLLSADNTLVPSDRVRLFHPSTFHGVKLGSDADLPIAWVRRRPHGGPRTKLAPRGRYKRTAAGVFEAIGATWPIKAAVPLTGAVEESGGRRFWEARERDGASGAALYIAEDDASIAKAAKHLPFGVKPDQKWMIVHLGDATLVAYEGLRPVFTTLVSPGRGGIPVAGQDNVEASTTPLGTFYVTFKDRAATMTHDKPGEPRTHWIADVPFTQYFNPPFALHAAYWHDRFGEDTSAGCINVSPEDAELLFGWSDPQLPAEWQGVTGAGAPENGPTTAIVIHR